MISGKCRRPLLLSPILLLFAFANTNLAAQQTEGTQPSTAARPSLSGGDKAAEPESATAPEPSKSEPIDKRAFGILPDYRTARKSEQYTPITNRQKFVIAAKDSFDYPLVFVAAGFAGLGQLTDQNPSFGQGLKGYGHRLGTSYADQTIGNMMTEAIFPSLLREDPRYFLRGTGSIRSRVFYAISRIFVTRTDSGKMSFNFAEVAGNAAAVAISNAYYPDGRTVGDSVTKLAEQLATDALSQVLKEIWPDIKKKLARHHDTQSVPQ